MFLVFGNESYFFVLKIRRYLSSRYQRKFIWELVRKTIDSMLPNIATDRDNASYYNLQLSRGISTTNQRFEFLPRQPFQIVGTSNFELSLMLVMI